MTVKISWKHDLQTWQLGTHRRKVDSQPEPQTPSFTMTPDHRNADEMHIVKEGNTRARTIGKRKDTRLEFSKEKEHTVE